MRLLTLNQLRTIHEGEFEAGLTLRANGAAFELHIETPSGTARLIKSRKEQGEPAVRRFADPREAMKELRKIGIIQAHIDWQQWRPDEMRTTYRREDRSRELKEAHRLLVLEKERQEAEQPLAPQGGSAEEGRIEPVETRHVAKEIGISRREGNRERPSIVEVRKKREFHSK